MIGLRPIAFLGAEDDAQDQARIHVETKTSVVGCPRCGVLARVKGRSAVSRAGRAASPWTPAPARCGAASGLCTAVAGNQIGDVHERLCHYADLHPSLPSIVPGK
jgi:hypothetical protein